MSRSATDNGNFTVHTRRMQREWQLETATQILLVRTKLSNDLIDFQSEHGHAQMRKMNQEERDTTIMHRCRLYCTIDLVVVIRAPLAPSTMTHSSSSLSSNTILRKCIHAKRCSWKFTRCPFTSGFYRPLYYFFFFIETTARINRHSKLLNCVDSDKDRYYY